MSPVKDPSAYGDDWPHVSAFIRYHRSGGRCECRGECATRGARQRACLNAIGDGDRCQAINGMASPRTGARIVLTVAHLDDNPGTNDPERLRAMCQACHLAYDIRIHRANRIASARGDVLPLFEEEAIA